MPNYMTQKMSSGTRTPITYYRKQTQAHVTHKESGAFTQAAKTSYAATNNLTVGQVEAGTFKSGQGVPTGSNVSLI
jgi:hypothetical protein